MVAQPCGGRVGFQRIPPQKSPETGVGSQCKTSPCLDKFPDWHWARRLTLTVASLLQPRSLQLRVAEGVGFDRVMHSKRPD
jgi:hypothetical protein